MLPGKGRLFCQRYLRRQGGHTYCNFIGQFEKKEAKGDGAMMVESAKKREWETVSSYRKEILEQFERSVIDVFHKLLGTKRYE